jgi:hypothetical protein
LTLDKTILVYYYTIFYRFSLRTIPGFSHLYKVDDETEDAADETAVEDEETRPA